MCQGTVHLYQTAIFGELRFHFLLLQSILQSLYNIIAVNVYCAKVKVFDSNYNFVLSLYRIAGNSQPLRQISFKF